MTEAINGGGQLLTGGEKLSDTIYAPTVIFTIDISSTMTQLNLEHVGCSLASKPPSHSYSLRNGGLRALGALPLSALPRSRGRGSRRSWAVSHRRL